MLPPHRGLGALLLALLVLATAGSAASADLSDGRVDDPVYQQGLQWGLDVIHAPPAWSAGTGAGTTIAIVDSGGDLQHEDLAGKIVGQVSCVGAEGDPRRCSGSAQDVNGHGTHVAGIAAASTDNGRGIAGVAPGADLLIVRVLSNACDGQDECTATGSAADVAAGIRWATQQGADVINLSLGGSALGSVLGCAFCDAVDEAWQAGAIPVIAAGNDSMLPPSFADEPAVIVAATTRDDGLASYSNGTGGLTGDARWPVAAPGGEGETDPADCATGGQPKGILSTYWVADAADQYACLAGTSMAAPHVSGALAILLGRGLSPEQAVNRLLSTAEDLGPAGRDDDFGYGRIDLARALDADLTPSSTVPPGPSTTVAPPTTAGSPTTAATVPTTTTVPPVSVPEPVAAAPFTPAAPSPEEPEEVPAALRALAIALTAGVAIALAVAAPKLLRRA